MSDASIPESLLTWVLALRLSKELAIVSTEQTVLLAGKLADSHIVFPSRSRGLFCPALPLHSVSTPKQGTHP